MSNHTTTDHEDRTIYGLLDVTLQTKSRIETMIEDTAAFEIAAHFEGDGMTTERARAEVEALWAEEPESKDEEHLLDHTVARVIERLEDTRPRLSRLAESIAILMWIGLVSLALFTFLVMLTGDGTLTQRLLLSVSLLPVAALWDWARVRNVKATRLP